jgi:hypothetical protein
VNTKPIHTRRTFLHNAHSLALAGLPIIGLLLATTSVVAQQKAPLATSTVRDHLWMFAVPPPGASWYFESGGVRGGSRMTPAEACYWLDIPNLLFIRQAGPPDMRTEKRWKAKITKEQYAISFQPLTRVLWSATGSGGIGGESQVDDIVFLAENYPNITGVYLDDFVTHKKIQPDGRRVGKPAMTTDELNSMRERLRNIGRPMEVWATIYTHEFDPKYRDFAECDPPLVESMNYFDVAVMWTWKSAELRDLEKNLALLESIKPKNCRIALGLYLWDYTGRPVAKPEGQNQPDLIGMPVPPELMEYQCSLGLRWLKEGRVSDLVVLANNALDIGLENAGWIRQWIKKVGSEKLNR